MRRSAQVATPLLASAALALLAGCRHPEMQRCVDETNHVVDDALCANLPANGQQPLNTGTGSSVGRFHYYYGGTGSRSVGSFASGGSNTALAGHSYSTRTSRGGFGRTMSSGHGGGQYMNRIRLTPRPDWQSIVAAEGLTFHTLDNGQPYWDESACYEFTAAEVDTLEAAANQLQEMCLAAAQHVIDRRRYAELSIPAAAIPAIERAWNAEPPALYGRFDMLWAGASNGHPPKLLEYNADTPTSLLEAAVIQWSWLEAVGPHLPTHRLLSFTAPKPDQFNSLHEKIIAKWKDVTPYLRQPIYFSGVDTPEDTLTLAYLEDTAQQAGIETRRIAMLDIGWNEPRQCFVDLEEIQIHSLFKLYPWEIMLNEDFGPHALATYDPGHGPRPTQPVTWIEPVWKLLLSNKGLLPILWELYPNHPLLLETYFDTPRGLTGYVRKPLLSREGANIALTYADGTTVETSGPYAGPTARFVYQALAPAAIFPDAQNQDRFPVLGLWMIDQECCGMGIRESAGPITDNFSSFLPHFFR